MSTVPLEARLEREWQRAIRLLPRCSGPWRCSGVFRQGDPLQGWKIHVSATVLSAAKVYRRARPILLQTGSVYKVPATLRVLATLNSGLGEFSQVGKFLTVYARSSDEALRLAESLHRATAGLAGPAVPFDQTYRTGSLVYYRYGAFRNSRKGGRDFLRAPEGGRYEDKRAIGCAIPSWVANPFPKSRSYDSLLRAFIRQGLLLSGTKSQRGKGCVYEAVDLSVFPRRAVILKEGRRNGETNWDGQDGYALVKREAQILRCLRKAGLPVPEVLREFVHGGNRYLVMERISGRPLLPSKRKQPLPSRRVQFTLGRVEALLSNLHTAHWVWRDCKPSHFFFERGVLRCIDFEGACRTNETSLRPWGSPNYIPPSSLGKHSRRSGTLEDDYAFGVIAFQLVSGELPPKDFLRRAALYRRSRCAEPLRERIEKLLRY